MVGTVNTMSHRNGPTDLTVRIDRNSLTDLTVRIDQNDLTDPTVRIDRIVRTGQTDQNRTDSKPARNIRICATPKLHAFQITIRAHTNANAVLVTEEMVRATVNLNVLLFLAIYFSQITWSIFFQELHATRKIFAITTLNVSQIGMDSWIAFASLVSTATDCIADPCQVCWK